MDDPHFEDKRVRRAFGHLINRAEIIETLYYGMATMTNSPINPNKPYYNKNIPNIEYDLEAAKKLLADAGWKDTDSDGILDKKVKGKQVDMVVKYKYNQGNDTRKNIGLMLKDEAERVGIKVEVINREWTVFLADIKDRDFEMYCGAWVQGPELDDLRQIWHTDAITADGSNRVGFGNDASDAIIDKIPYTLDEAERNQLYYEIQEIIHDEQPYVFLFVPSERIAISRRFEGAETSALRPGYMERFFSLRNADVQ